MAKIIDLALTMVTDDGFLYGFIAGIGIGMLMMARWDRKERKTR